MTQTWGVAPTHRQLGHLAGRAMAAAAPLLLLQVRVRVRVQPGCGEHRRPLEQEQQPSERAQARSRKSCPRAAVARAAAAGVARWQPLQRVCSPRVAVPPPRRPGRWRATLTRRTGSRVDCRQLTPARRHPGRASRSPAHATRRCRVAPRRATEQSGYGWAWLPAASFPRRRRRAAQRSSTAVGQWVATDRRRRGNPRRRSGRW